MCRKVLSGIFLFFFFFILLSVFLASGRLGHFYQKSQKKGATSRGCSPFCLLVCLVYGGMGWLIGFIFVQNPQALRPSVQSPICGWECCCNRGWATRFRRGLSSRRVFIGVVDDKESLVYRYGNLFVSRWMERTALRKRWNGGWKGYRVTRISPHTPLWSEGHTSKGLMKHSGVGLGRGRK